MAEKEKVKLKVCPDNWHDVVIETLFQAIKTERCFAAAIGLDMAAQQNNWGLSLITIDESYTKGHLRLLLPHLNSNDAPPEEFAVAPSYTYLKEILTRLRSLEIVTALAVDIPLGWPIWHGKFTDGWTAKAMAAPPAQLSKRDVFERRITDIELRKKIKSVLLAVGADKIGSAAYEWALCRDKLGMLIDACDVGFGLDGKPKVTLFETYPAGFVRLNFPEYVKYKSGERKTKKCPNPRSAKNIRRKLLNKVRQIYNFSDSGCESHIDQACKDSKSDAFDGFLSALTAWDYLRWQKYGDDSHATTTPKSLLRRNPTTDEINTIEKEGWILIRNSELKDVAAWQNTSES
ncbi:MAG: hypothetical protein RLY14_294 [Planctomycetota bacterium]|jgi:hypothetical protein